MRFANGVELRMGETRGPDKEAVFEGRIRYTIEEHFRKQARLRPLGLKVLTLFFIDRVENYVRNDGIIGWLFRKCFDKLKGKYAGWEGMDADRVQAAYFAARRTRGGEVVYEDSRSGPSPVDDVGRGRVGCGRRRAAIQLSKAGIGRTSGTRLPFP